MNCVNLIGNVGQTPEFNTFVSGKRNARLTIAINSYRKEQEPMWVRCDFWETVADRLALCNVQKGTKISITGSLAPNNWEKKVGDTTVTMKSMFVRVIGFDVLTPKGSVPSDDPVPETEAVAEAPEQVAQIFEGKAVKSRK